MTEKRFKEYYQRKTIVSVHDTKNNNELVNILQCVDLLNRIADENKQLKSTMKEVAELLKEEVDLFSDKATKHDINAYRELNQLDNKDAYYMATAIKKAIKLLKGDVND